MSEEQRIKSGKFCAYRLMIELSGLSFVRHMQGKLSMGWACCGTWRKTFLAFLAFANTRKLAFFLAAVKKSELYSPALHMQTGVSRSGDGLGPSTCVL